MAISETNIRTGIENGRARYAFTAVNQHIQNKNVDSSNYKSYIKKIPAMIQVNGLGQTMAFCLAKKKEYKAIYDQIENWIRMNNSELIKKYEPENRKEFIDVLVSMNSSDYRIVTTETMALLNWMRRFADGLIA